MSSQYLVYFCSIWQFKYAKDQFDFLAVEAKKVAAGNHEAIMLMADILPVAFKQMDIAVNYFAEGLSTCAEKTTWSIDLQDWKQLIIAMGYTRGLTQKLACEFIWSELKLKYDRNSRRRANIS